MLKKLLIILILLSGLFAEEYEENREYQLGEGAQVGSLPLYIGGYFSLDYRYKDSKSRYRVDDLALLAYGNYDKLSYMAELEFKEFYTLAEDENGFSTTQDKALHVERLYIDYNFNENYMFRGGKYNSQVGFWNLLPINVLRDTTSNPISTEIIFPKFTTGIYASYNSFDDGDFQVDIMLQHNDDFDSEYNNYVIDEYYALGISYLKNDLALKLDIGMFDNYMPDNTTQNLYYVLASMKYETQNYQVMSEVGTQSATDGVTTEYAAYLQGVYHLSEQHAAIVRLESYNDKLHDVEDNIAIFAYTYRPLYPVVFKAEYQLHSRSDENQLLCSFSVLF